LRKKEELLRFLSARLLEQREAAQDKPAGKAAEWLGTAKGSVHVAPSESADDVRIEY
jgi:hypothetical protein